MMRILVYFTIFIISSISTLAQDTKAIVLIDRVEVPVEKRAEAIFYYENNWKLYRERAMHEGVIKSYRIIEIAPTGADHLELILMTEFSNDAQLEKVEENFAPIMKQVRPSGPILLNETKPAEFRKLLSSRIAHALSEPSK